MKFALQKRRKVSQLAETMTSQDVEFHLEQMIPEIRDLEER